MENNLVLTEADAIELYTTLIMTARTQLDDPAHYSSMRFLDVARRLAEKIEGRATTDLQAMLAETATSIADSDAQMADKTAYAAAIDTVCAQVATYLVANSHVGGNDATS